MKNLVLVFLFSSVCIPSALANDAAIGLDGGTLVFKNLKGVTMKKETLYLSDRKVTVRYEFVNTTQKAIATHVGFPIRWREDCGARNFDWKSDNPLKFKAKVNGKTIRTKIRKTGFDRLKGDRCGVDVSVTHYWFQTFPAKGKVVVEHSYVPVFSSSVWDMMKDKWDAASQKDLKKRFCPTTRQLKDIKKRNLNSHHLHYILQTARTWDGPIGEFTLIAEKGSNAHMLTCSKLALRKVKGTSRYTVTLKNFIPRKDIDIAFVYKAKR